MPLLVCLESNGSRLAVRRKTRYEEKGSMQKREKLRDDWIVGFLVVKTGDSTCRPRDSKEGYIYRTILGFY